MNVSKHTIYCCVLLFAGIYLLPYSSTAQKRKKTSASSHTVKRVYYGNASYYDDKFHGRMTASGEIFNQGKMTAACNILPLGTWIKVTNLKNNKSVVVRTTDRLRKYMPRVVDLSKSAAKKLGYINSGLARVRVEVIPNKS